MAKIFYFDVETTGLHYWRHSIHQLSGAIEIDGKVEETFDFRVRPYHAAIIEDEALAIAGVTREQVLAYPEQKVIHKQLCDILKKYVDQYAKKHVKEKLWMVGYNSQGFDVDFFRAFFKQCGDNYFGSWFWPHSIDVMVLALHQLMYDRREMENFKLATVAKKLGITVDEERLHDALYDIWLTRECFKVLNHLKPRKVVAQASLLDSVDPVLFCVNCGKETPHWISEDMNQCRACLAQTINAKTS